MDRAREIRKKARGNTIVPFFPRGGTSEPVLEAKPKDYKKRVRKAYWFDVEEDEYPGPPDAYLAYLDSDGKIRAFRKMVSSRRAKIIMDTRYDAEKKRGLRGKNQYRIKIQELFTFINDTHPQVVVRLIQIFDRKIGEGLIGNVAQMEAFYKKCSELASCLKIFLEKSEFYGNFKVDSDDIIDDLFQTGFSEEKQRKHDEQHGDYFKGSE